jgi:hypothetical protein
MHMCSASTTTPTPFGSELTLEPVGDLRRQPLLDLEMAAEELDHTTELAEPDDPLARQIADVRHPLEREQVVHAQRVERDRPRDDQLVVTLIVGKGGGSKGLGREQLGIRLGDPARGLLESLGVDIGAKPPQKVARRALDCLVVDLAGHDVGAG